jgi:hypothetical protein
MVQIQKIDVANEVFAPAKMFDLAIIRSTGVTSRDNEHDSDSSVLYGSISIEHQTSLRIQWHGAHASLLLSTGATTGSDDR